MSNLLLNKIASFESLKKAWDCLDKTNKQSHGLSGETIEDFEKNLIDKLNSISKRLLEKKYAFRPNRAVTIPKPNSQKERPLQIPEISDRVVLKAIALELEIIFAPTISQSEGYSFAYQKDFGIKEAIYKVQDHYRNGYHYSLEADLANFFGEVSKDDLINKTVLPTLPDSSIDELIISALNQKVEGLDQLTPTQQRYFDNVGKGIPQGNPLSPLLSNIYLAPFDRHLIIRNFKLVRYADDFIILCKDEIQCREAYEECCIVLEKLKLQIHSLEEGKKTKIIDIKTDTLTFLSVTFDGHTTYPSSENFERIKSKIRDVCNGKQRHDVMTLLRKLANRHDGWISAFIFTSLEKYSEELDWFINRQLFLALRTYDWKFQSSSMGKLPRKFCHPGESRDCLSDRQRENSGIPATNKLIQRKRLAQAKEIKLKSTTNSFTLEKQTV